MNRKLILEQIRARAGISRREIADMTGLSKAAVSTIVAELIDAGLVEETGSQSNAIGRPRILLSLVPQAGLALGAELTAHECRVVLTDLRATPLRRVVRPVPGHDLAVDTLLAILQEAVAEVTQGVETSKILGMGLTLPAVVDPSTGTVLLSVILPWQNVALGDTLNRRFPYPVVIFSRGSAATWGERWYGAGQNAQNMLYVRVGSGIVAGLVLNGQPYLGQGFGAGELGHMTVQPDGMLCRCGNRGCLATVATTDALLSRTRQLLREQPDNPLWTELQHRLESLSLADVVSAVAAGNDLAIQALHEIAHWLSIALAASINLLNLDMIIVGGPLLATGEALLQPLRANLHQRALPTHLARVQVVASSLKEDAPSVGAASLILHELMSPAPLPLAPAFTS
ncbi:MAG TPA: ROK family transcriptional regulator [Caldilineaceae bacterium]|nr:ROK family transcriptional regulator [Caldilineaceae bacterium]